MSCEDILNQQKELQSIFFRLDYRGMQVEAALVGLSAAGRAFG